MKPKLIHICWLIVCACWHPVHSQVQNDAAWSAYGGDPGGQRYSTARQLNPTTVVDLKVAWEYHTGALDSKKAGYLSASFESTPILFADTLIFATPFDEIIAVSAETGRKRWSFDPGVVSAEGYLVTSRGVAVWTSERPGPCRDRVFFGTLDARLIALDAANGNRCSGFGKNGEVAIAPQSKTELLSPADAFSVTSPPTVIGNVVIIGSSVGDNFQARMASGSVRAFDAVSGKPLWQWDPIPWAQNRAVRAGAANAWSIISADPALGLAFIPTGSASPDYFGGLRPGRNEDADSIVALQASSGKKVWSFQLVHHDLWDYDTAAQPLLFTFHGDIPAVAVTNKTGMVYVLDRRTGTPIYPVYERSVPASDVPGEQASRTQPFSSLPALNPLQATVGAACLQKASKLRYEGIFTPPSLAGSLEYPGKLGGVNWGSAAYDPETGVYYAATNRAPFEVRLIPRNWLSDVTTLSSARLVQSLPFVRPRILLIGLALMVTGLIGSLFRRSLMMGSYLGLGILGLAGLQLISFQFLVNRLQFKRLHTILGVDDSPMYETPFTLYLRPLTDGSGAPCTGQPWGAITAVNLQTAQRVWEKPLGTMIEGAHTGSLELGGPIVTAGGLVFAAGTRDPYLRAFDKSSGQELWRGRLPAPAQATPMTYSMNGRQFVVIAAGGHGLFNTEQGDSLVAFALKKE